MGVLHTDSLVLADSALAQAVLAGELPLGEAQAGGLLPLAWSLKHACEEACLVDAALAARAARLLADLVVAQGPTASGGDTTLAALANWADGLALLAAGTPQSALAPLERAGSAWLAQGQALRAAQVAAVRLKTQVMLGHFADVADHADACVDRLAALGDAQGAALLRLLQGDLGVRQHQPEAALAHYQDAAERLDRLQDHAHALIARIGQAQALVLAGQVPQAQLAWQHAAQQAALHRLPALAAAVGHGQALFDLGLGRHEVALDGLLGVQQAFEHLGRSAQAIEVQRDLAAAYLARRQLPEALAQHRSLVARVQGQGDAPALPWVHLHQARAMACAGQHDAAASSLGWARALFHLRPDLHNGPAGLAQAELARLQLVLDHLPEADAAASAAAVAQQALELCADLAAPLRAQASLLQVRAHRLAGSLSEALRLLPALCRPLGAAGTPWLQAQAWAEAGHVQLAVAQAVRQQQLAGAASATATAWQPAAAAFEQAIQRFDDLQAAQPGGADAQHAAASWLLPACEARLALAMCHASPEQALVWLHRVRLRQLRLSQGDSSLPPGADAAAVAHIGALRLQCFWLQRQLQRHLEDALPGGTAAWEAALQQAELGLLEATRQLRRQALPAGLPQDDEDALDIPALCHHFQGDRALVAYAQVHGQLVAVVIARGRVQRMLTGAGQLQLLQAVNSLHLHLDTQGLDEAALAARLPQMLQRCTQRLQTLHALVWAPLLPALDGAADLVVVPCAPLQAVPFAALHDGKQWLDQQCRPRMAATVALAVPGAGRMPVHVNVADEVGSLWAVPERTAAGFVQRLRVHHDRGNSTATAMQRARAELRALHPHPSVWAAFSLNAGAAAQRPRSADLVSEWAAAGA